MNKSNNNNVKSSAIKRDIKHTKLIKPATSVTKESLVLPEELKDALPKTAQDYLKYASPLTDGADEFLLTPFLAMCGTLIGKRRYLRFGSIKIYPTIWTVLFAGSTQFRKSTALRIAKDPFRAITEEWEQEYLNELTEWKREKKKCEEKELEFDLPEPIRRTLYCPDGFSDLTFWESLRDQGSLISTPSEFTALWNEIVQPRNNLSEISLSMFDAEDYVQRKTKSGGDIILKNPVWSIAGATTVSNFQRTLTANERGSGLLQRILPVYVGERKKRFKALTEVDSKDEVLLDQITQALKSLDKLEEKAVPLTDEAKEFFTEKSHKLNHLSDDLSILIPDIGGYTSRLDTYMYKFALIFQMLDDSSKRISKKNARASVKLSNWLLQHIIFMLNNNYIFSRYYRDRLKIREILDKQSSGVITRTDLMNRTHLDKSDLDRALESEITAGNVLREEIPTDGRTKIRYKKVRAA